ncbi:uncharacterized protein LOC135828061 [Sycon ciliatum]|uniref:uncharacterized protein LOC135828061 n=1 Tax=Sycon ciliatum TaxID=27933 RepID=UPI0031F6DE6B
MSSLRLLQVLIFITTFGSLAVHLVDAHWILNDDDWNNCPWYQLLKIQSHYVHNQAFYQDCTIAGESPHQWVTSVLFRRTGWDSLPHGFNNCLENLINLTLTTGSIKTFKENDLANLVMLERLHINNNGLTELPGSLFRDLISLTEIEAYQNRLTTLPAEIFQNTTKLSRLDLHHNWISSLPTELFQNALNLVYFSPEEQSHQWGRHFDGVLNVASAWNRNALDNIPQRQEADHLAEAPTLREVSRAISRPQNGKSAGASGILPEMLKRGGPDLTAKLVELFGDEPSSAILTSAKLLEMWGDTDTICVKVAQRRLEWLGHVARMDSSRMPRQILLGSLPTRRPAHGPHKRWKDCVVSDLRVRGLAKEWYPIACESSADWRTMYAEPVENVPQPDPVVACKPCKGGASYPHILQRMADAFEQLDIAGRNISYNNMTSVPAGMFNITRLDIGYNELSTFPKGQFTHLGKLDAVYMERNVLRTLKTGVFTGLVSVKEIFLEYNQLDTIQEGVFQGLVSLNTVILHHNFLIALPANLFHSCGSLITIELQNNQLRTLPAGAFNGLGRLSTLELQNNQLRTLPAGAFNGLGRLSTL